MRYLYDPVKALTVVATGATVVGALKEGSSKASATRTNAALDQDRANAEADAIERNANAEAGFLADQAAQEEIATQRDRRDNAVERSRTLAMTRAALAASGGDLAGSQEVAILGSQAGEFAVRDTRMAQDLQTSRASLFKRAATVVDLASKQAADVRRVGALSSTLAGDYANDITSASRIGAIGAAASGVATLLRK